VGTPEQSALDGPKSRMREYADVLNPLFWHDSFNRVDRLFEFVCTLVRAAGLRDTGWDSHQESLAFLEDLNKLSALPLPADEFAQPESTKVRLALLSYCHVTEMNVPYEIVANLLRLRTGLKYAIDPFAHLHPVPKKGKKAKLWQGRRPLSPEKKIQEIEKLSEQAKLPEIGKALRDVYDSVIRNAVYHSDYVLHEGSLRLLSGHRRSKADNAMTPRISFAELIEFINDAFAFYSALFGLYSRTCRSFQGFHNTMLPLDSYYKGLLELTFDGDELTGFRTYWPNGNLSIYARTKAGCIGQNLTFESDGSINFMVGIFASTPGAFSPCVEAGAEPVYAFVPGTCTRPYWPKELKGYILTP
jgi:hypothetical protein